MATFAQIKEVRLTVSDPAGFIDFVEVANQAALPDPAAAQTAYKAVDSGTYFWFNSDTSSYEPVKLRVSDGRIGGWIDAFGTDGAILKSVQAIVSSLPGEMMIVKNDDGAESTEFLKLLDIQKFYQNWLRDLTPADVASPSGVYLKTKKPCIAGGNV